MSHIRVSAVLSAILLFAPPTFADPTPPPGSVTGKLPDIVRPLDYRIEIVPDVDKLVSGPSGADVDFRGSEEVTVEVQAPTDTVTVKAAGIAFVRVAVDGAPAAEIRSDGKADTASFRFASMLTTGLHTLSITYGGKIGTRPTGIFYSEYDRDDDSGRKGRMLITQFEATDARRMFPGWDQPAFKATFTLSIVMPPSFNVSSNMPITSQETGPGNKKVTFARSPKMSTYLAALVASESGQVRETFEGVDVGVITTPPRRAPKGRYALEQTGRILPYYNTYFGIPYPLPKLDLIAVPNFSFTAMENWGAITYIDYSLLFDDSNSTQEIKEGIFETVAHEVAHQWFGDLVTMTWWEDLWLNEGFATWMQKKISNDLNADWHIWHRAGNDKDAVIAQDALRTAHPIQQKIADERQIDGAFDDITYSKSGAVIRMIEDFVGAEAFRAGIRDYIKGRAYANASTADLWSAVDHASGKQVGDIAQTFVASSGVPLIRVNETCTDSQTTVVLTQDRFILGNIADDKRAWTVPVRLGRPGEGAPRLSLVGATGQQEVFDGCDEPVKANVGNIGYYRVQYDRTTLDRLIDAYRKLTPEDRLNLVADTWGMVETGLADFSSYVDLLGQMGGETDLAVWNSVVGVLRMIDDLERGEADRPAFRACGRRLLRPVLAQLGFDPKPGEPTPLTSLTRALMIKTLGRFDDVAVLKEARAHFGQDPTTLDKEMRKPVAEVAAYMADGEIFGRLRKLGRDAPDTETKLKYYYALAGASRPEQLDDMMQIALGDELPSGRVDRFLAQAARESDKPDEVWQRAFDMREPLLRKMTTAQGYGLLPQIGISSLSPTVLDALKRVVVAAESPVARYEADKAVAWINFRLDLKKRLLPAVGQWRCGT
jgi:aminopeptidase N